MCIILKVIQAQAQNQPLPHLLLEKFVFISQKMLWSCRVASCPWSIFHVLLMGRHLESFESHKMNKSTFPKVRKCCDRITCGTVWFPDQTKESCLLTKSIVRCTLAENRMEEPKVLTFANNIPCMLLLAKGSISNPDDPKLSNSVSYKIVARKRIFLENPRKSV